jgi:hypothetical protein
MDSTHASVVSIDSGLGTRLIPEPSIPVNL